MRRRNREKAAAGDTAAAVDDGDKITEGEGQRAAKIDSGFTNLIILVLVLVISCVLLVTMIPDHPLALQLMSLLDSTAHLLCLTTPVYAVVLDAGSTGSRVLGFTFFLSPITGNKTFFLLLR